MTLPSLSYRDPAYVLEVREEANRFNARIDNWRRIARERLWQSATCWSAEGRYAAPTDETAALPEEDIEEALSRARNSPWPIDIDEARKSIADAWMFEDVWRFIPDRPRPFRLMLALVYHRTGRWSVGRVTVRLGIRRDDYDPVLRAARAILRNRVRTMDARKP